MKEAIRRIPSDTLKKYIETRDPKLREQLILHYMPMAKRLVLNLGVTDIDNDDLIQIAYEALILIIDTITNYDQFYVRLNKKICIQVKKYIDDYRQINIPISEVEIQSNLNLEECAVSEMMTKYLSEKTLAVYSNKRNVKLFKRYISEKTTYSKLAKEFNLSIERVRQICYQLPIRIKAALMKKNKYISISQLYNDHNFNDECDTIENSHTYTKK